MCESCGATMLSMMMTWCHLSTWRYVKVCGMEPPYISTYYSLTMLGFSYHVVHAESREIIIGSKLISFLQLQQKLDLKCLPPVSGVYSTIFHAAINQNNAAGVHSVCLPDFKWIHPLSIILQMEVFNCEWLQSAWILCPLFVDAHN